MSILALGAMPKQQQQQLHPRPLGFVDGEAVIESAVPDKRITTVNVKLIRKCREVANLDELCVITIIVNNTYPAISPTAPTAKPARPPRIADPQSIFSA